MLLPRGKQDLTYVEAHSSFGGREGERRESSELWGEGCDHSVVEYYCHNGYTRAHSEVHTWANVYKYMEVEMLMCIVAALVHANTHLHMHLYTSDSSPLRWSPVGTAIFCTSTCHLDPAQRTRRVRLPLLSSTLFYPSHSFFFPRSLFFIPRCVKPASYDNSASRDMLTLLVDSASATVFC